MFNEKFESILNGYFEKNSEISKGYSEFNEKVRVEKQKKDRDVIRGTALSQLKSLHSEINTRSIELEKELREKTTSKFANEETYKMYVATEYANALGVLSKQPREIDAVLEDAFNSGRLEFAEAIIKGIFNNPNSSDGLKYAARKQREAWEEKSGVRLLRDEKVGLDYVGCRINEFTELAQLDPDRFDQKVVYDTMANQRMNEAETGGYGNGYGNDRY